MAGKLRGSVNIGSATPLLLFTRRREDAKIFGSRRDAEDAEREGDENGPFARKKCRAGDRMVLFVSLGRPGT